MIDEMEIIKGAEESRICPLTLISRDKPVRCKKEECEWYIGDCAVAIIASRLDYMVILMEGK